jgi:hypothetical protein
MGFGFGRQCWTEQKLARVEGKGRELDSDLDASAVLTPSKIISGIQTFQ